MIHAAISFFVIGLLAYVLGANGLAGLSIEVGKILLIVFVVLAVGSFLINAVNGRKTKGL